MASSQTLNPQGSTTSILVIALFASLGWSQGASQRCDVVGVPKLSSDGTVLRSCLDLNKLSGDTLLIPSNATRIAQDGLALCKSAVQEGGMADIAYILDQSGSMYSNYLWVNPINGDTTFLFSLAGCTSMRSQDTVGSGSIHFEESGTRTVRVLNPNRSISGCFEFAGDPYGQRGVAFKNAIQYQSELSPTSTAGYLGFGTVVDDAVRLSTLTPANVARIQASIRMRSSRTNYRPPLDSAKRWLRDTSLTNTQKQAIIFLSDGLPGDNYLDLLTDGKMPPIYGIFLGNPSADYRKLEQLSDTTGGEFYLIPPGNPDSLKSVVKSILNIILKSYSPVSATLRNESLNPVQESRSLQPDFTAQGEASWRMRLDEIVALAPNTSNVMRLTTQFREANTTNTESRTTLFVLKTTEAAASGTSVIADSLFALTCYDPSRLRWLDGTNRSVQSITEADSLAKLTLVTAPEDAATQTTRPGSILLGDTLTVTLNNQNVTGDSSVFQGSLLMLAGKTAANRANALEARGFDTLISRWQHPRDSQDTASIRVLVSAANRPAALRFSLTDDGPVASQIPPSATRAYLILDDQPTTTGTRTIQLTSTNLGLDAETINLTETSPGHFQGFFNLKPGVKALNNGVLEVSPNGDQLRAVYKDPAFGDSAVAQIGFDQMPQEAASLHFVDGNGTILLNGAFITPSQLAGIRLVYSDDFAVGSISSKAAEMNLKSSWNNKTVLADMETISLATQSPLSDSRGVWSQAVQVFEGSSATSGDGLLNFRYLGNLVATVQSHDNTGRPDNQSLQASLHIAYPDAASSLTWINIDTAGLAGGSVEGIQLSFLDQDYAPGILDSTFAIVSCPKSGDSLSLVIKETSAGKFGPISIGRNMATPNASDSWISCPDGADLIVRHVDPVYATTQSWILPQVATPQADPTSRSFLLSQLVNLSTQTSQALIWFTVNGSAPDTVTGKAYTTPLTLFKTTFLQARAFKTGYRPSGLLTQTYTKQFMPSQITVLDAVGNPIPNGILFDAATSIQIQVRTSQGGLSEVKPTLLSAATDDIEEKRLFDMRLEGNAYVYQEPVTLYFGSATPGDDTLSLASEDTLIVSWKNPENPLDIADDTILVRPRFYKPTAFFTDTRGGSRTSLYPANQDSAYVWIDGRPKLSSPTAQVSSLISGTDLETISLKETSPGKYVGAISILSAGAKTGGDGRISVTLSGDQLKVLFVDPIYRDTAIGSAGFAQGVEETGSLLITDASKTPYAPNASVLPSVGKIHFTYSDDWNAGIATLVASPTVQVVLTQKKDGGVFAIDTETVTLTFDSNTTTLGYWSGSVNVSQTGSAKSQDGTLQTAYLSEVLATIATHNNAGNADNGRSQARIRLVYPDQVADIRIEDEIGDLPSRPSKEIQVTLEDGPQLTTGQPLSINLTCEGTGDSVRLQLVFSSSDSTWKGTVVKLEGSANKQDTSLSCAAEDVLVGTYQDPTHQTEQKIRLLWTDPVSEKLYFTLQGDSIPILILTDSAAKRFELHLISQSPKRDVRDTLTVNLTTADGDKETVRLVETGPMTGHFVGTTPFYFTTKPAKTNNDTVQVQVDLKKDVPEVRVEARRSDVTATLVLKTKVKRLLSAAILDLNRDGQPDAGHLHFASSIEAVPTGDITLHWAAQEDQARRVVSKSDFKIMQGQLGLEAGVQQKPWTLGLTSLGSPQPMAKLPDEAPWFGQEIALDDSVGPIPVKAVKLPSDLTTIVISEYEKRFSPDTLIIDVSEPIQSPSSFKSMLRFSSGCAGWENSLTVVTYGEPTSNAEKTQWTILVDNTPQAKLPLTGDCIYLETDGRYTDRHRNPPSPVSVKLQGENPKLAIRLVQGYPPVAGLEAQDPAFLLANSDARTDRNGRFSKETSGSWDVLWIPPVGFSAKDPMNSDIPNSPSDEPSFTTPETGFPSVLPSDISVVQIATTGRYVANVAIFDNTGHFVRRTRQAFGYRGELRNPYRSSEKGMLSFLVWDMKDQFGAQVGQGVFIWKIHFTFADGKQEIRVIRTGVIRR